MHSRAIGRAVGTSAGTAARELKRLEDAGLVERQREGNQVYFAVAHGSAILESFSDIVRKTIGVPSTVRRSLAGLAGVERVVIFGSYARATDKADSDIDLLVIGNPERDELTDRLERAGHEVGRPVNEVVMSPEELEARRTRGDGFIASIDTGPVIEVAP
jgi:predicted nucleotidyltransferase